MFLETARAFSGAFAPFRPCAPITERAKWENLPQKLKQELVQNGEAFLSYAYPLIPATKYMEFCRIGNRSLFEELYFTRRRVLNALVLAECVESQGRFTDDIINGIMAICEESGWPLPAHNNWPDDAHFCLPDLSNPSMDLFACETGAQLAIAAYLLKEKLDAVSPLVCKRIYSELEHRIVTPYLTQHFRWMGGRGTDVNNWTPWCTQNTLITVFAMEGIDHERQQRVMEQAAQSLDIFMDTYGEDGCCNEGAGYYHAAGLCVFGAMEVLDAVSGDAFLPFYNLEKIKNMAAYIMNVHIDDPYYANFSDCATKAGRAGVREFLFAKRVGNADMMRFAAKEHQADPVHLLPRSENLFYRLQAAFHEQEIATFDCTPPIHKRDLYYESVGMLVARDTHFFLAVKSGCNDDSHNHNDTGSIILYRDGKPMLIDVGVETYCRKTFSPQRYEIWSMQSAYHNVLTFGDVMQQDGRAYAAKAVEVSLEETSVRISMELADCYPRGTVESYTREVVFLKEREIRVTDRCTPCVPGTFLSLMSQTKPTFREGVLSLGEQGTLRLNGDVHVDIEPIAITDPKLLTEWGTTLYRTKVFLHGCEISMSIQI